MKILILWVLSSSIALAMKVERVGLPVPFNMTRADVWIAEPPKKPVAVLVICPGMNGSAEKMIRERFWQDFATKSQLALVGLSFASSSKNIEDGLGYSNSDQGAGELLLGMIDQKWGDVPILLYGFSSGALFVETFVQWKPRRALAWCAHATGRYEESPKSWPPGIVSCGELDAGRLGPSLTHFQKGRAAGNQLLWISLPSCSHVWPNELHKFVQQYFSAILKGDKDGLWVDIDSKKTLNEAEALRQPALSAWIPSMVLFRSWEGLHQP